MLAVLARLVTKRGWQVLAVSAILAVVAVIYGSGALSVMRDGVTPNPTSESTREQKAFERAFPEQQYGLLVLFSSPTLTVDDPAFHSGAQPALGVLKKDESVASVIDYFETPAPLLVSRDRHETFVPVVLKGDGPAQAEAFLRLSNTLKGGPLQVRLGGVAAVSKEINAQIKTDIARSERISFGILAILLLFIFRSVVAAVLPLVVGGLSIVTAFALTRIVANYADVTIYAANIITFLGLGLAIDYSLFILSRFREELDKLGDSSQAVVATMRSAGRTVAFSGSIVALSLLGLLVFPRNFLYSMAIGGSLAVFASVAVSLTVLPALLGLLGTRIDKGRIALTRKKPIDPSEEGFWTRMSHFVMRRAGIVVALVLGILFVAGSPFLNVKLNTVDAKTLPTSFESRQVNDELAKNFDLRSNNPIEIMLTMPGNPTEAPNRTAFEAYVSRLEKTAGVNRVHSELNRDPLSELSRASGNLTKIDLDFEGEPQAKPAQDLVAAIRGVPAPPGSEALVGGSTAILVDLVYDLQAHIWQALLVIGVSTFVLLLFMLNSILVPLKAIVFNALSLSAAFGGLVWVFQYGHFENLIGFKSVGAIDANEPILIFVIAFGLAVDYEVFLVSRMKEAYDRGESTVDSVAFGLEKTGQIITSAALLLMVVIGAFTTGKLSVMKQLGFGLGLAVLIDATLVRSLLVPATMKFLGKYNWWTPPFLARIIERANLGEH